jgi:hypothetical protein
VLPHHVVFWPYWFCNAGATSTTYCKILGQKIPRHGNKVISFIHCQVSSQDPIGTIMLVCNTNNILQKLLGQKNSKAWEQSNQSHPPSSNFSTQLLFLRLCWFSAQWSWMYVSGWKVGGVINSIFLRRNFHQILTWKIGFRPIQMFLSWKKVTQILQISKVNCQT